MFFYEHVITPGAVAIGISSNCIAAVQGLDEGPAIVQTQSAPSSAPAECAAAVVLKEEHIETACTVAIGYSCYRVTPIRGLDE